jgi:RimJ/RimL family protein N-acetyltransferase
MPSNPLRLQTPRLELVAATAEMLQADLAGRKELAEALGVDVPDAWPPVNWERGPIEYLMGWMQKRPDAPGWFAWYCTLLPSTFGRGAGGEGMNELKKQSNPPNQNTLIGGLGFLGPPNAAGETEMGYSLLSDFHRQGYGPEALSALVDWAFSQPGLDMLIIRTAPHHRPSIRVAKKLGFQFVGPGPDPDTIEYALDRAGWIQLRPNIA